MRYFLFTSCLFLFISVNYSFSQSSESAPVTSLAKAKELLKDKRYGESKVVLKKIIDENGKQADPHYLLSRVFYSRMMLMPPKTRPNKQ